MSEQNTAEWWADGWCRAYEGRAYAYLGKMPDEEHKRMMYASKRMDEAFDREQKWRDEHRTEAA